MDQALLVGLALLPVAVGVLARLTERSWVAPPTFFALVWSAVAVPAALVFAGVPGLSAALIWIFVATATVWLGALAARYAAPWGAAARPDDAAARRQLPGLRAIVLVAALAGVAEVVLLFARQDFSLSAALSYAVIAQVTEFNRAEYLSGAIDQGVAERLAFLCMYGGALFGGMLFRLSRSLLESILALTPLVLLLVVFGLYGSRMGALYGGSFWIGAYLATTILVGTWRDVLGWRFLLRVGVVAGVLGFSVPVATQVWRYSLGWRGLDWFLFGYGFVGRALFTRVAGGRVGSVGALTLVYAFALTSVAFSIFSYTVTALAMIGFIVYCLVAPRVLPLNQDE